MTPDEQNIALAEWSGWKIDDELEDGAIVGTPPGGGWDMIPDYFTDLNAVAECETRLIFSKRQEYFKQVQSVMSPKGKLERFKIVMDECICAPASIRCEALLRTLNLWKE